MGLVLRVETSLDGFLVLRATYLVKSHYFLKFSCLLKSLLSNLSLLSGISDSEKKMSFLVSCIFSYKIVDFFRYLLIQF